MRYFLTDGREILVRPFRSTDFEKLVDYYAGLNDVSKMRFSPHSFDRTDLGIIYSQQTDIVGYVLFSAHEDRMIGYSVCKLGFFEYDNDRFSKCGYRLNAYSDCFYAPSVADDWQGVGVGKIAFDFVKADLWMRGYKRVFLWGGVQISNVKGVSYYNKLGFVDVGEFEYNGLNKDMVLYI